LQEALNEIEMRDEGFVPPPVQQRGSHAAAVKHSAHPASSGGRAWQNVARQVIYHITSTNAFFTPIS